MKTRVNPKKSILSTKSLTSMQTLKTLQPLAPASALPLGPKAAVIVPNKSHVIPPTANPAGNAAHSGMPTSSAGGNQPTVNFVNLTNNSPNPLKTKKSIASVKSYSANLFNSGFGSMNNISYNVLNNITNINEFKRTSKSVKFMNMVKKDRFLITIKFTSTWGSASSQNASNLTANIGNSNNSIPHDIQKHHSVSLNSENNDSVNESITSATGAAAKEDIADGGYGEIRLSSLTIFGHDKKPIEICQIATIPDSTDLAALSTLLDKDYAKNEESTWVEKFNGHEFSIVLSVRSLEEAKTLRILNPNTRTPSACKDFSVFLGNSMCWKGEVSQTFGVNVVLKGNEFNTIEYELFPETLFYRDTFGIYPCERISKLKLEFYETYNEEGKIGLNGLDLIEMNDSALERERIESFVIGGIQNLADNGMLLRTDKVTTESSEMFLGDVAIDLVPTITITFKEPISLLKIEIWNFNAFDRNLAFGVKKVRLYANERLFWSGTVPKGQGTLRNIEASVRSIWFCDKTSYESFSKI